MDLSGLRVLVVEDEFLVALSLENDLKALGCDVVGPATSLSAALEAAQHEGLDAALLDVSLGADSVFPAAARLADRGVPFVFCSAFTGPQAMPDAFADRPRVLKPFTGTMIAAALEAVVDAAAQPDDASPAAEGQEVDEGEADGSEADGFRPARPASTGETCFEPSARARGSAPKPAFHRFCGPFF